MYYGYMLVAQCNNANLDGLWKILAGLGIGIIPYGINVQLKNTKEEAATMKPTCNYKRQLQMKEIIGESYERFILNWQVTTLIILVMVRRHS
ncbi:MAG: hypothetical protein U0T81_13500 [Saprospiraceae bacterium]